MLKRKSFIILGLILSSFALNSCESKDGDVEDIQITINGKNCQSSTFDVSTSGGEYKVYSKNYGTLWLNEITENGNTVWPENHDWLDYKNIHLTQEWYNIQYDESGNIVVNIQAKEKDTPSRSLTFYVECGDAFDTITLSQK